MRVPVAESGSVELVPVGRVAEMLDVHPETVRRYLAEGLLRGRRLPGKHRRIELRSVHELIAVWDSPPGEVQDKALEALRKRNLEWLERQSAP